MNIIDAHIHYGDPHPDLRTLLDELDMKLLNICVVHDEMGNWREQAERYCSLAQQYPTRFAWCTSFALPRFDDPDYGPIGAHIGSLEYDVDVAAQRLARYPNFALDVSARLGDLAIQDSAKVRDFFFQFPDRILFGTDVVMRQDLTQMSNEARAQALANLRHTFDTYFAYFESDQIVDVRGHKTRGLGLPQEILEQFYHSNAQAWYPGL